MMKGPQSSGDLRADRRHAYGRDFLARGEPEAAADLFSQALELAPDWAAGHFALAQAREAAGDTAGARAAFARAGELDPDGELGAPLHLARLGATPLPDAPPEGYVRALFDDYADRFEASLVTALGYTAPTRLAAMIATLRTAPFGRVMDAGCGTGLAAAALTEAGGWSRLEGVDLSGEMVARAASRGVYDELTVGEVVATLRACAGTYDLIIAADLLVYLGDLAPFFAAASAALAPGSLLALSIELADAAEAADGPGWVLRESLRFAHCPGYLTVLAEAAGLALVASEETMLRRDRGLPLTGFLALFGKPA
ncbi:methyltransferase domain-containing protein [Segnochrobactraceae bacterium EtOH-i3]